MTEYDWTTVRAQAVERFGGDPPGPQLEQDIIDVFRTHPQVVVRSIDRVAAAWEAGRVRSPWAVLRHEVREASQPGADVTATDTSDREKAIQRAEQWLHAAGIHLDRISEVEHELFGNAVIAPTLTKHGEPIETGGSAMLAAWRDDRALRERMVALWRELRPRGEQIEAAAEARGRAYAERRAVEAAERKARLETVPVDDGEPVISDPDPEPVVFAKEAT